MQFSRKIIGWHLHLWGWSPPNRSRKSWIRHWTTISLFFYDNINSSQTSQFSIIYHSKFYWSSTMMSSKYMWHARNSELQCHTVNEDVEKPHDTGCTNHKLRVFLLKKFPFKKKPQACSSSLSISSFQRNFLHQNILNLANVNRWSKILHKYLNVSGFLQAFPKD